jgi:type II secretory pathway pseudopilin PulG
MAQPKRTDERGFAMVALLIAMAIAAIWATAALPKWRTQVQRGREEDLIFRGEQYARAIVLYQDKNRNLPPPSIDVLISQHYLRKKWKDPVTNDEFALVGIGLVSQTSTSPTSPAGVAGGSANQGRAGGGAAPINTGGNQSPGITGVRSKSTATSIKIYQQQQQYNLWQFDAATYRQNSGRQIQQQQPGGGRQGQPGQGAPGQGGPGGARGGPGGVGGRGGEAGSPVRPGTPPPAPVGGRGGRGGN